MSVPYRLLATLFIGLVLLDIQTALPASELHQAAQAGHLEDLRLRLKTHPELLESRDLNGRTLLCSAAAAGQLETVQWLLANGADPNTGDHTGQTPLSLAEANRHATVVAELKKHGAGAVDFSRVNDSVIGGGTWCMFGAIALSGLGLFFFILTRKKRSPDDLLADEMNDQG